MKFRYKVIIINIILLAIGLSIVGNFMIKKNYNLAIDSKIQSAIEENNIIQSSVEYRMLDTINSTNNIGTRLGEIGEQTFNSVLSESTNIYILYGNDMVYASNDEADFIPDELLSTDDIGKKKYYISNIGQKHYLYVATCNILSSSCYIIINRLDITSVYDMISKQQHYFIILLITAIAFCSIMISIVSYFLTKPMEKLNHISSRFAEGDYSARATINSSDEIGELADTYNKMANAVSSHVEELNDMIRRRDQFVADFTHELKTPMTSIIGYSDMLRSRDMSREDQIMSASYIFNEGKRLEGMSQKLFDFIYLKEHDIDSKPFSTEILAKRVCESVTPGFKAKGLQLTVDFENVLLDGDIELLISAFINLIDNARKASPEGGEIIFGGHRVDNSYSILVKDFGIGISKENIDKICDEFFMADKSRSRREGGAGLGLSLASEIFKRHNAKLAIESTLGEGTCMTIEFEKYDEVQTDE